MVLRFLIALGIFVNAFAGGPVAADDHMVDANLLTAIDVSGSIDGGAERLEIEGMAEALAHPAVQQAITRGVHGRIGFAAFTWSSQGDFVMLVPWTRIVSREDALRVAERLRRARGVPRFGHTTEPEAPRRVWRKSLGTDISEAIVQATALFMASPFASTRPILNLCANGIDNIGHHPDRARDAALARGIVINGLVLGQDKEVATYLREHVQGGPGSFVLEARQFDDMVDAMLAKFTMDLAAGFPSLEPG